MEVERLVVGTQVREQVEYLGHYLVRTGIHAVDLVHHHQRTQPASQCLLQDKPRLWHGTFEGIDHQQRPVRHREHPLHLTAEIGMARCVDKVDTVGIAGGGLVVYRTILAENRDPAFAFQVARIQNQPMLATRAAVEFLGTIQPRLVQ